MESTVLGKMLRYHWVWILVFALAGLSAGAFLGKQVEPEYSATSTIILTVDASGGLRPGELLNGVNLAARKAQTYSSAATSDTVVNTIVSNGLTAGPSPFDRRKIVATAADKSPIISISVRDIDPIRASTVANGLADATIAFVSSTEATTQDSTTVVSAKLLNRAATPTSSNALAQSTVLGLGLIAGIVFGLAVAYAVANGDRRVRDTRSVEILTHRPVIGALAPNFVRRRFSRVASSESESLSALILSMSRRTPIRSIVLLPTASSRRAVDFVNELAEGLSGPEFRVAIVDFSASRRSSAEESTHDAGPGLMQVLEGSVELDNALFRSPSRHFDRLRAGSVANDASALASPHLGEVIRELGSTYDLILCVVPPTKESAACYSLGQFVDAGMLIVPMNRTLAPDLAKIATTFELLQLPLVGSVVV